MLKPHEPGLRLSCGVSRSGKTYGQRKRIIAASEKIPVVVVDRVREWKTIPREALPRACPPCESWAEALTELESGKRLVVLYTSTATLRNDAVEAFRWARDYPGVAGVALSEAHRAFPNGSPLPDAVDDCVTAWAHYDAAVYVDTQRLARIDTTIAENSTELRIYATRGARDYERIREIGGRELEDAVRVCGQRKRDGERGWHVLVDDDEDYSPKRDK